MKKIPCSSDILEKAAPQTVAKLSHGVRFSVHFSIHHDSVFKDHTYFWVPLSQHAAFIDICCIDILKLQEQSLVVNHGCFKQFTWSNDGHFVVHYHTLRVNIHYFSLLQCSKKVVMASEHIKYRLYILQVLLQSRHVSEEHTGQCSLHKALDWEKLCEYTDSYVCSWNYLSS